ncbi:Ras-related protein rsr1 [Sporothrix epigloea]|uniref:Ras-related protein rsr1 n=1 Tax=Sporothrix epigloea TaxID=1892477 RepID=A0ABP0E7B7_9PEZI
MLTPSSREFHVVILGGVAMRDLYMKTGQGFLLVFSITSPSSLSEIDSLREEIIRIKDDDTTPMVVIGNKADLEDQRAVSRSKAFSLAQNWNAPYYESSARTRTNVDEVFIDLCRQMIRREEHVSVFEDDDKVPAAQPAVRWNRRRRREGGHRCVIL